MAITHAFVSVKDQSADPTVVSANEWNDAHAIADESIALAHLADDAVAAFQPAATGTPDGNKFLGDDNSWQSVPPGGLSNPQVLARAFVKC